MCHMRYKQCCYDFRCPYFLSTIFVFVLVAIIGNLTSWSYFGLSKVSSIDEMTSDVTEHASGDQFEKWMEYLPSGVISQTQLKDLLIPGSHDSATFDLDPAGGKADDFSSYIKMADEKIERWFKTQNLDFTEQLKFGVRYFDLRIIKHPETGDIRFVHGLFSRKTVIEYLKDIRKFLDENKKEVVLLDFNHLYNMDKHDHISLCTEMESTFSGMMLNRKKCLDSDMLLSKMTLSNLWELNGRVVVMYGNVRKCPNNEYIWSRNEIDILWPYTPNKELVVNNLMDQYKGLSKKDVLVVWHGILTPHSDDNFSDRMERFKNLHEFVTPTTEVIVNWIKSHSSVPFNICCADFVEEHDFVKTVINANIKSAIV
ncbi:PI-PLC X domain-containing protein 3-like [Mytilus trossulus]|uniref:PI-PLC X domain-containing protein 3-like n=1 Tax=Mytilus trossulus TaxID=6551 RepID=UPI003004128B